MGAEVAHREDGLAKQRLLFSIPYGLAFRAVVATGLVGECRRRDHDVCVLLPRLAREDAPRIRAELPSGVTVRELRPVPRTFRFSALKFLKQHLYYQRTGSETFRVKRKERRARQPVFHAFASVAERAAELLVEEAWLDRRFERTRQPHEAHYARELREKRIDAVVITKPGYHPDELPLVQAAKRMGIPVVSVDTTWDNIVSKRPAYIAPDVVTVWNEGMRRQAIEYYRIDAGDVPVTGGPQFDIFFQRDRLPDRGEFLRALGLDPDRPLIVLALNNPSLTPANAAYVSLVSAIARRTNRGRGANLIVRLHPWDREGDYRAAAGGGANVRVEHAFGRPSPDSVFECLPTAADVVHYGALIAAADVVVNIASTATLDAIAADRPVLSLAFDPEPTSADLSVTRFCDFTHMRALIETGAVGVPRSASEMEASIDEALSAPARGADGRAEARRKFLTFADGRSGERVIDAITGARHGGGAT